MFGRSRAVQKASVAASLDAEGSYRSDQGAVWREVSYSLRETRRRRQLRTTGKGARRSPTRSTRSSSAFSQWTGRSAPFPLRAASSVWNCWARRTCLKVPAQDHPELRLRGTQRRGSRQRARSTAASWWAGMQAAPCSRRPSPGAGYDLRIDTGEVIGSGTLLEPLLAHLSCFPGAGPGPLPERPGPGVPRRASAAAT